MGSVKKKRNTKIVDMPTLTLVKLNEIEKKIQHMPLSLIERELTEIDEYVVRFILLVSGDDTITKLELISTYMFFKSCGFLPKVTEFNYKSFMCFDSSPELTAKIGQERVDDLQNSSKYKHLEPIFDRISCGNKDLFLFVHLMYILLEMQCNYNKGVSHVLTRI
jgi:hypothetical protein